MTILKELRVSKGDSQLLVATRLGIHPQIISGLENRRIPLFPKYRNKLADFYAVDPGALIDESGFARIAA